MVQDLWKEPEGYIPPQNALELIERYEAGERYFKYAKLSSAVLKKVRLAGINLSGSYLPGAVLKDARLNNAIMEGVNLDGADLEHAHLKGATLEGATLMGSVFYGTYAHNVNFRGSNLSRAKLVSSSFSGSNFEGASLKEASLRCANLDETNFQRADLEGVDLYRAGLNKADLSQANLMASNLYRTDLNGADLGGANLVRATLESASIRGANFADAVLGHTGLIDLDFRAMCEHSMSHAARSIIDWRSVARSLKAPNLAQFLVDTGMPLVAATYLIDSLRSLDELELFNMLQSVFLSYGEPDNEFAKKLRDTLKSNGVLTWFFSDDALPGDRLHKTMHHGVNEYERMILVCSRASIMRPGVRYEIEQVLARELRDGGASVLLPINLDGYIFEENTKLARDYPRIRQEILSRVVADFSEHTDPESFNVGVQKLLKALQKPKEEK